MGIEQGPSANEYSRPREVFIPPEVSEMDQELVSEAKVIFQDNHELVKEAMFGMGSRKAKEVLENLAACREQTKKAVMDFRKAKEKTFLRS